MDIVTVLLTLSVIALIKGICMIALPKTVKYAVYTFTKTEKNIRSLGLISIFFAVFLYVITLIF